MCIIYIYTYVQNRIEISRNLNINSLRVDVDELSRTYDKVSGRQIRLL